LDDRRLALNRLAALLKHQGRRPEAVPVWEQLASFTLDDPLAFVELAKFYEWQARDLVQAAAWTERALSVVSGAPAGWQRAAALTELQRRQERLKAKQLAPRRRPERQAKAAGRFEH
jgi:tetratricopeptide (TPR) repeat protein